MFKISAMMLVCLMVFCVPGFAQQMDQVVQAPVLGQEEVMDEKSTVDEVKGGMVSLNFRDVDMKDVLRVLSYESGINIVAGPEVTGLVTIQLDDVPWLRALDVVVQMYGYAYDRRDNIITVTTVENLKKRREDAVILAEQEPLMMSTFVLNYAKAIDVISSIEKMKTARGSITYDERTNAIIIRDISSNVEVIAEVIAQLDKITPQVLIEAKIIEITLGNTEKMGIDWAVIVSGAGAVWPTSWPLTKDAGNRKSFFPDISAEVAKDVFSYGTLDFSEFTAVLDMLDSRSDTNTLSNPRIVTLDNQTARIVVGKQYPFPEYTYNEDQARMQVSGWEYRDIGVIFEVTPHVNNAGMVTLDLKPKITAIIDDADVTVEGTTVPQLTTREASTSVMIKDGHTLVIGGLISDVVTDSESKIPFLGDIPLLGRLFSHKSKVKSKTDLLIFITPHIITPELDS